MAGQTTSSNGADYGRRTLMNIIDSVAAADPARPFCYVPCSDDPQDGWKAVCYKDVANAIDYLAYELRGRVEGDATAHDYPTVAYMGPSDIRYFIVMFSCIKSGCKAYFPSPKNSLGGQLSLLKETDCNIFYFATSHWSAVQPLLEHRQMEVVEAPGASIWLSSTSPPFPYHRTFDQSRWDPLVVLHTSGSTGVPKPITLRQGSAVIGDALLGLPKLNGSPNLWRHLTTSFNRFFMPMPLFHGAGLVSVLLLAVCGAVPVAFPVPDRPITADMVTRSLEYSGADAAFLPPSVLEDIASTIEGVAVLASLKTVVFGGGNLNRATGDLLASQGVKLNNVISSTEYFPYPLHAQSNPHLWQYFIINSDVMGADWRPVGWDEDVYELWVRRKDREPHEQSVFYTFPELSEWTTGDLYKPHPTLRNHWSYYGRADNVIVFSNGEKLNPVTIEDALSQHPAVKGAIVGGQDRFQPILILEPRDAPIGNVDTFIDGVWPSVEKVNRDTVAHGRIDRRLIMVVDAETPFLRAPKGTIQRSQTLQAYQERVNEFYRRAEQAIESKDVMILDLSCEANLAQCIIDIVTTSASKLCIRTDDDFFNAGVDSLQVINLSRTLRSSLRKTGLSIAEEVTAPKAIYANPTPRLLAANILASASHSGNAARSLSQAIRDRGVKELQAIVEKYTRDLPPPNIQQRTPPENGLTVILTGSTGSLGTYLLDALSASPRVEGIVALNRGASGGRDRQLYASSTRGLDTDFAKVQFFSADLSKPNFGLDPKTYKDLLAKTDRIIHNAWPVNFNIGLPSFEPSIRGVRHLVDFANQTEKRVPIIYISSVGTAQAWSNSLPVPEEKLEDLTLAHMGYGRSKLAGSLILDAAVEQSNICAASIRVGQIAGSRSKRGMWNKHEFLPSLVASSVYLGVMPNSLGSQDLVDWCAVEDIAGLVLDVAAITTRCPVSLITGYFHGVNPKTTTWAALADAIKDYYGGRIKSVISFHAWLRALEESAERSTGADLERNPAVKLIDTYRGMIHRNDSGQSQVKFSMKRTKDYSPTMNNAEAITAGLVRHWCQQWGF